MAETRKIETRRRQQRRRRPVSVLPPVTRARPRAIKWSDGYAYPPGAVSVISDNVPHDEEESLLVA